MALPPKQPVFRFAPSPNGLLHLGHAASALRNWDMARECGGRLLLRIEDIDRERCRPEFEIALLDDLAWLGLVWEHPVRRQSEHLPDYAHALHTIVRRGLAYPCFCSRTMIAERLHSAPDWPRDPDGNPLYPGTCRGMDSAHARARIAAGQPASFRLDMQSALACIAQPLQWCEGSVPHANIEAQPRRWGDVLIARKDIGTSYHLAVTVDDALQGVTDIVRGADLFDATSVHRVLQEILGLPSPIYHHHPLLMDSMGRKLSKSLASKSLASKSLRALRDDGASVADVRQLAAF